MRMTINLHLHLFIGIIITCFTSLSSARRHGTAHEKLSCKQEFTNCDESGIRHLHINETQHFELQGSWTLALLNDAETNSTPSDGTNFKGFVSLTRIRRCAIKFSFEYMVFGTQNQKFSETVLVGVDGNTARQVCRESRPNEIIWGSPERSKERDDQVAGLASSLVSAITNNGIHEENVNIQKTTVIEVDNFGRCPTLYEKTRTSEHESKVRKYRDLGSCGESVQKFAKESGEIFWSSLPLHDSVDKSEWECSQYYDHGRVKSLECSHNVEVAGTSKFTSNISLTFRSSEQSDINDSTDFTEIYDLLQKEKEAFEMRHTDQFQETQLLLKSICENSGNGLLTDAILSFPKTMTLMNTLNKENIIKLYQMMKNKSLCPDNPYFIGFFNSILRDTVSPAASSAKCQIMIDNDMPINAGWISSLANTVQPTVETLRSCSGLLSMASWTKTVVGVSSLAGVYRSNHCFSETEDLDNCHLGDDFSFITKALWLKAAYCIDPDDDAQKMAFWGIQGLANVGSVGDHVTKTLISCIRSVEAKPEVKIGSLRALAKKKCNPKTASDLQSFVFNNNWSSEMRIEAFKTLLQCDSRAARNIIDKVSQGKMELQSSQVTSYVDSYAEHQNGTNLFRLSRHFSLNLDSILGRSDHSKLEGDLIFEDSFLPRAISLNLQSGLLKQFDGIANFEIRQKNLEEVLQPLLGPEGARESLQSLLQDVILSFFDSLRDPQNVKTDDKTRPKRSISVEDLKTSLMKVKKKVTEKLHTMLSVGLGHRYKYSSTYSFNPLISDFETFLQEYMDSIVTSLYSSIASYEMSQGFSWGLRSSESLAWSFLGHRLSLRQHEGIITTLKMSSHLSLFSMLESPFNPSVDVTFNPNVAGYRYSSIEFAGNRKVSEAKLESPLHVGFDVHIKMKPKQAEDHLEVHIDVPKESFHGYSLTIAKELTTTDSSLTVGSSHVEKLKEKGVSARLNPKHPVDIVTESIDCNEGFWNGLGLQSCFESSTWKGERSSIVHSKFGFAKIDNNINHYKIFISAKNPGQGSVFLSALIETEGSATKREGNVVFGFDLSPHPTLRILASGGTFSSSFEAIIVNDGNLKRLEVRSNVGGEEHGLKAEILMVRDGGQVSIKPRLVISSPTAREDALLDGYIAHYSSDKVRSFTIDLQTQGSLKRFYDVALKGTTEYRWKPSGDWLIRLKNVHLISPGFDLGLETSLIVNENTAGISSQVTLNGDVVIFGVDFRKTDVTDGSGKYEVGLQFLRPKDPLWDTKIIFVTSVFDGQIHNNLTVVSGPENHLWQMSVFHSTSWTFIYSPLPDDDKAEDLWGRLLRKGRIVRIANTMKLKLPNNDVHFDLDHNFEASDSSIENKVVCLYLGVPYSIMANFYDQSQDKFKYHMEIEMDFPEWKFTYVDTLLETAEGNVIGQSVATMPSGRVYRSSTRLRYENTFDYLNFELSYDTQVREGSDEFRISFQTSLENTPIILNFFLNLKNPEPVIGVDFDLEGSGTDPVRHLFLMAFLSGIVEGEMTARSTTAQTNVALSLDLISYSKLIKSEVSLGRTVSGGSTFNGEMVMNSPHDPSFRPVTMGGTFTLHIKEGGNYIVKSNFNLMGSEWSAQVKTELGKKTNDLHKFTVTFTLPDKSRLDGESHFLLHFTDEHQNLGCKTEVKLPSGIIYKLEIGGSSLFKEGALAEANLLIDIDSPFTKEMLLKTLITNHVQEDRRNFSFLCNTKSEAHYWNELEIDIKWKQTDETIKTIFGGKFGDKEVQLDSFGSYKVQNESHFLEIVTEVNMPLGSSMEQLKLSMNGDLLTTQNPPGIKISQAAYIQRNYQELLKSSGELLLNIPETKGSLIIDHQGPKFKHQDYKMQGSFNGQELKVSVEGMVDTTPVRINIHYTDGETLKVFASYGGASFASVEFTSELEGLSLGLRKTLSELSKVTTNGQITFRNHQTRFHHLLRLSPTHSSSNLQINSLRGRPVSILTSRNKLSRNEWKTVAKLVWGRIRFSYDDEVIFRGFKDFDVKASVNAPFFGLRDLLFHVISKSDDAADQNMSIKYMREEEVIHSGRFSITTTSLESNNPFVINAELVDIVLDRKVYNSFKFRQYLALPKSGIEIESLLMRGKARVAEIGLSTLENKRKVLFAVCSMDVKCLRFKGEVESFSEKLFTRNFGVEVKFLNSIFCYKTDDIIEHSLSLAAENKDEGADDIRMVGKISRSLCSDELCEESFYVAKHHLHLTTSPKNMDVLYETLNRTMLLKTSLTKEFNKSISENESQVLKLQLWFDRINSPDNVIIWSTSYQVNDLDVKVDEIVESVIQHPYIDRPLTVTGTLSSFRSSRREALIHLDVFRSPKNALQLYIVNDYTDGGYNLQAHLKDAEEETPHLSMSAVLIPSPDYGFFNLTFNAPLMELNQEGEDRNMSFHYICKMDVDPQTTQMLCEMSSITLREEFALSFGYAPSPCSGVTSSSRVFGNTYEVYGTHCTSPLNVTASISLAEEDEKELKVKAGFMNSNTFDVDFLGIVKSGVVLFPPYLLEGSFQYVQSPLQKFTEFKHNLVSEWEYLVLKSKGTTAKILEDLKEFSGIVEDISKYSHIDDIAEIITQNSRQVLEEFSNDVLLQDISSAVETSVILSGELLENGIAFVKNLTGHAFEIESIDFYTLKIQNITSLMVSNVVYEIQKEMNWLHSFTKTMISDMKSGFQELLHEFLNISFIREPVQWLRQKAQELFSTDPMVFLQDIFEDTYHMARQVLSLIYSNIGKNILEEKSIMIPLSESFYTLESVLRSLSGEDVRKFTPTSLHDEIKRWLHLVAHPQELIEETLPPYDGEAVLVKDALITFDGKVHSMDPSCSHLLMALKGGNGTTPLALASGYGDKEAAPNFREFLLLAGNNTIRILPDREIVVNSESIPFPFQMDSIKVSKDLNEVKVTVTGSQEERLLSLSCGVDRDSCFVDVNGWFLADVKGLLGTYDYNSHNDLTTPDGAVSLSREMWESSWRVNDNCSNTDFNFVSMETDLQSRFVDLCSQFLLYKNSYVVPCHSTVNVYPYFMTCLSSLKSKVKDTRIVSSGKVISKRNHNYRSLSHRRQNPVNDDFNSVWKRSRQRLQMQYLGVRKSEREALCDVASAYSSVCLNHNVALHLPPDCDKYPLRPRSDRIKTEKLSIDLLILLEETNCIDFIHKFIISSLTRDMREILSTNTDIQIGVIGYGSTEGAPLAFYGKGSSFLVPFDEFVPPQLQTRPPKRGTLKDAFKAASKFPFRPGSVRVLYVASCSDQDLPKLNSGAVRDIRKRRVIVISMTNEPILHSSRSSASIRNAIGFGTRHIYHLQRGNVERKTTMFIIPSTSLAYLSLQSGGSVFTVRSVSQEKLVPYYMKIFRQIFIKAIIQSSEKVYADVKNKHSGYHT